MSFPASRLALGTAQFGLDYGINNRGGRIPPAEVDRILHVAEMAGIDMLDTAVAYGNAHEVLGACLAANPGRFKVVSKIAPDAVTATEVAESFARAKAALRVPSLYGVLVHDFERFIARPENWKMLRALRERGEVSKIGFSVYFPAQINRLIDEEVDFDLVQLPFSVFDQRFAAQLHRLKARNVEIHIRSVFLQGLYFVSDDSLPAHFSSVSEKLTKLKTIARSNGVPLAAVALGFAMQLAEGARVVIGVDDARSLQENIHALEYADRIPELLTELRNLAVTDEAIILPFNWPN